MKVFQMETKKQKTIRRRKLLMKEKLAMMKIFSLLQKCISTWLRSMKRVNFPKAVFCHDQDYFQKHQIEWFKTMSKKMNKINKMKNMIKKEVKNKKNCFHSFSKNSKYWNLNCWKIVLQTNQEW